MISELILLIPDEQSIERFGKLLTADGIKFLSTASTSEFLGIVKQQHPSHALIDFAGFENELMPLLRTVLRQHRGAAVYLFNVPPGHQRSETLRLSTSGVFERGASPHQIVSEMLKQSNLLDRMKGEGIVGCSAAIIQAAETITQLTHTDVTVLIGGESGTGKEMYARAIHNLSNRRNKPFVAVNCGAISEGVLESELFGHEKGAFTGAAGKREGYFENADGGTIFLDEIGEIRPDVQVRLLRVLEQRSFMRVGGTEQVSVDVRVIAASNRDLKEMTDDGRFREDLFYRLSVVTLNAEPLRERPVDIMPLIYRFIDDHNRPDVTVDAEAVELLLRYSWPGNIRELRNFVESTLVTLADDVISKSAVADYISRQTRSNRHLPVVTGKTRETADFQLIYQALLNLAHEVSGLRDSIESRFVGSDRAGEPSVMSDMEILSDSTTLEDMERHMIAEALKKVDGNRRKAAELLGIGQRTLYRKIKEYGL